jgi:hypothetical protein
MNKHFYTLSSKRTSFNDVKMNNCKKLTVVEKRSCVSPASALVNDLTSIKMKLPGRDPKKKLIVARINALRKAELETCECTFKGEEY